MNQKKIGEFIAKLRKENDLTQQELADKINVTSKAVSKWENGRSLMDISLLSPLSNILGVSVLELLNGERIKDDSKPLVADETLKKSFNYAQKKIRKSRVKTIIGTILIIMFAFSISFVFTKLYLLKKYEVKDYKNEKYQNIINSLNKQDTLTIYKKTISEDDYLSFQNIRIRNDFSEYTNEMDNTGYASSTYNLYKDSKLLAMFSISTFETYIELFKNNILFSSNEDMKNQFNKADRGYMLLKYDINDDIDLLNYLKDNYYQNSNIFSSVRDIKESAALKVFANTITPNVESLTIINGDYHGYIFNCKNNLKEVNIIRNNKRYVFIFGGTLANDEYIKDLLSTLEIRY